MFQSLPVSHSTKPAWVINNFIRKSFVSSWSLDSPRGNFSKVLRFWLNMTVFLRKMLVFIQKMQFLLWLFLFLNPFFFKFFLFRVGDEIKIFQKGWKFNMEYNCFLCNYKNQSCVYVMCVWVGENEMRWSRGPRDENIFTPFTSLSSLFGEKISIAPPYW